MGLCEVTSKLGNLVTTARLVRNDFFLSFKTIYMFFNRYVIPLTREGILKSPQGTWDRFVLNGTFKLNWPNNSQEDIFKA